MITRRGIFFNFLALGAIFTLSSCKADNEKKGISMNNKITMDVVVYSYLDRPINDIYLNDHDVGVAGSFGGGGVVVGVPVVFGVQSLRWTLGGPRGFPRNGEQVVSKNKIYLEPSIVPGGSYYMAVHIYPDETAELSFSKRIPERSARGIKIVEEFQKNHGQ